MSSNGEAESESTINVEQFSPSGAAANAAPTQPAIQPTQHKERIVGQAELAVVNGREDDINNSDKKSNQKKYNNENLKQQNSRQQLPFYPANNSGMMQQPHISMQQQQMNMNQMQPQNMMNHMMNANMNQNMYGRQPAHMMNMAPPNQQLGPSMIQMQAGVDENGNRIFIPVMAPQMQQGVGGQPMMMMMAPGQNGNVPVGAQYYAQPNMSGMPPNAQTGMYGRGGYVQPGMMPMMNPSMQQQQQQPMLQPQQSMNPSSQQQQSASPSQPNQARSVPYNPQHAPHQLSNYHPSTPASSAVASNSSPSQTVPTPAEGTSATAKPADSNGSSAHPSTSGDGTQPGASGSLHSSPGMRGTADLSHSPSNTGASMSHMQQQYPVPSGPGVVPMNRYVAVPMSPPTHMQLPQAGGVGISPMGGGNMPMQMAGSPMQGQPQGMYRYPMPQQQQPGQALPMGALPQQQSGQSGVMHHPMRPPQHNHPSSPSGSSDTAAALPPIPTPARRVFTVKDKAGNIIDINSLRKNTPSTASSTAVTPTAATTVTAAPVASTSVSSSGYPASEHTAAYTSSSSNTSLASITPLSTSDHSTTNPSTLNTSPAQSVGGTPFGVTPSASVDDLEKTLADSHIAAGVASSVIKTSTSVSVSGSCEQGVSTVHEGIAASHDQSVTTTSASPSASAATASVIQTSKEAEPAASASTCIPQDTTAAAAAAVSAVTASPAMTITINDGQHDKADASVATSGDGTEKEEEEEVEDWEVKTPTAAASLSTIAANAAAHVHLVTPTVPPPITQTTTTTTTASTVTSSPSTAAGTATYVNDKKGKKSFKSLLEKADAQDNARGSMLDAYVDAPKPPPPSTAVFADTATAQVAATVTETVDAEEVDEGWEKNAESIELKLASAAAAPRRLVPGGGQLASGSSGSSTSVTGGVSAHTDTPTVSSIQYTKEEVVKLKPDPKPERPVEMNAYTQVLVVDEAGNTSKSITIQGYTKFQRGTGGADRDRTSSKSQGQGEKSDRPRTERGDSRVGGSSSSLKTSEHSAESGAATSGDESVSGWKRESLPQPVAQTQQTQSRSSTYASNKGRNIASARPVKAITDPLQQLSTEVMQILNKITPQTFEKLTLKMCEIPIPTNALLDKLIELVFEKAIQEPNFANLYADMSAALENESRYWSFLQIVFNQDTNQYIWMLDLEFDTDLAGPYTSVEECCAVALSTDAIPYQSIAFKVQVDKVIISNNLVIKIFKRVHATPASTTASAASATAGVTSSTAASSDDMSSDNNNEFYVSVASFEDLAKDSSRMSLDTFDTEESARKDALKKNSFRRRLVSICQQEFIQSTSLEGVYAFLKEYAIWKESQSKLKLSTDDRLRQEEEWEEKKIKIKKRMLGNVRFIGELYKKGLITTKTIHSCLMHLIGRHNEEDQFEGFIETKDLDETDLEILCKFLPTVGALAEQKFNDEQYTQFNWFFKRLKELSTDKLINSRIRFSLEEMIALRSNDWQARRSEEGPAKLEDIHQKIAQEEQAKLQQQQQQQQQMMQQQQMQQTSKYGSGKYQSQGGGSQQQQTGYPSRPMTSGYTPRGGGAGYGPQGGSDRNYDNRNPQGGDRNYSNKQAPYTSSNPQQGAGGYDRRGTTPQQQSPYGQGGPRGGGYNTPGNPRDSGSSGGRFTNSASSGSGSNDRNTRNPPSRNDANPSSSFGSNDSLRNKMKALLNEYLNARDVPEVRNTLGECGSEAPGYFIDAFLMLYMNTSNKSTLSTLMQLLEDPLIVDLLRAPASRVMVEAALKAFEPLQMLLDTMNDLPQAHMRIAEVVGHLIRIKACDVMTVQDLVNECCLPEKAELQDVTLDDLKATYSFFVNALDL